MSTEPIAPPSSKVVCKIDGILFDLDATEFDAESLLPTVNFPVYKIREMVPNANSIAVLVVDENEDVVSQLYTWIKDSDESNQQIEPISEKINSKRGMIRERR